MIVSIASGKRGTGKTFVATNLALSIQKVQFIDREIEEPSQCFFENKTQRKEAVNVEI